jgi:hypothetical protein
MTSDLYGIMCQIAADKDEEENSLQKLQVPLSKETIRVPHIDSKPVWQDYHDHVLKKTAERRRYLERMRDWFGCHDCAHFRGTLGCRVLQWPIRRDMYQSREKCSRRG